MKSKKIDKAKVGSKAWMEKMKATKVQIEVLEKMQRGSVIGVLQNKINSRFELFTRNPDFKPSPRWNHSPFIIETLNKNTVFALLTLGVIEDDHLIGEKMKPFSRDCWYSVSYFKIVSRKRKAVTND